MGARLKGLGGGCGTLFATDNTFRSTSFTSEADTWAGQHHKKSLWQATCGGQRLALDGDKPSPALQHLPQCTLEVSPRGCATLGGAIFPPEHLL